MTFRAEHTFNTGPGYSHRKYYVWKFTRTADVLSECKFQLVVPSILCTQFVDSELCCCGAIDFTMLCFFSYNIYIKHYLRS